MLRSVEENLFFSHKERREANRGKDGEGGCGYFTNMTGPGPQGHDAKENYSNRFRDYVRNSDELSPVECWDEGMRKEM